MVSKLRLLSAIFGLTAVLAALPTLANGLVADIRDRGTLRVGMSVFVPWAMLDKRGELVGFEIDVARKLAGDMGVDVEFVPTDWDGIIPALRAEEFDVIIGGMTITPERSRLVDFTAPYATSGQQMAASRRLAGDLTERSDFNRPGIAIACRRGAVSCEVAGAMFPKAELHRFDDDAGAFRDVVEGKAHAVVSSAPLPMFWAGDHPDAVVIALDGETLDRSEQGFALRRDEADALAFFNDWIRANTDSGWLGERHDYWFRNRPAWREGVVVEQ